MTRKKITLLGATGSIGASALDVIARHPDRYEVFALTAHRQIDTLFGLCCSYRPAFAVVASADAAVALRAKLKAAFIQTEVLHGSEGLIAVAEASEVDSVLAAIVGAAGLLPTLAAVKAGKQLLLANKEALVMAGQLFMTEVAISGTVLLPIDSEHNAIYQSITRYISSDLSVCGVRKIILTASGGPFRTASLKSLESVTPEQACTHPNWSMGRKISVDSATLMNKGLEVIEAHWLFDMPPECIDVVVHPQSVIHSLVEYVDGSTLAQLGNPDMRTPIAYALAYPERTDAGVKPLDLFEVAKLTFERPDRERFPCLDLAYQALQEGASAPAILNAANEIAVDAFLDRRLPFMRIPEVIAATLDHMTPQATESIGHILEIDLQARQIATGAIRRYGA
ncbi:MAG: 1-deoxy-D-xylulose-5-phosphate reductoisomerase [Georgfuchsia sp.]